eukprot:TRINITY_DN5067_c0_g1_i2.p1 TRINITY_DN5067_c0_g1~~TRINITY_DN5067_c0_g1_i2.p1  ORF type:complete len:376 (+),score=78.76 TRINITY_DN5067_c0_g1_i2:75-1130(+)
MASAPQPTPVPLWGGAREWAPSLWRPGRLGDQVLVVESGGGHPRSRGDAVPRQLAAPPRDRGNPPTLAGCERDAEVVAAHFRSLRHRVDVINLGRGRAQPSTAVRATRDHITKCRGSAVLYYSGHGRKGDGAWCYGPAGGPDVITWQDVWRWISEARAERRCSNVVVVVDACFAGHWLALASLGNVEVLAACGASQLSWGTDMGHFTSWCFCGGLRPRGCHVTTRWLSIDGRRGEPERESREGLSGVTRSLCFELRPSRPRIVREEEHKDQPQDPQKAGPLPLPAPGVAGPPARPPPSEPRRPSGLRTASLGAARRRSPPPRPTPPRRHSDPFAATAAPLRTPQRLRVPLS